jgi:hypothetical protein
MQSMPPVRTTSFLNSLTKVSHESTDDSSFVRKTSFLNSVMKGSVAPESSDDNCVAVVASRLRDVSDSEADDDYASFRGKKQSKKKTADLIECKRALAVSPSGSEVKETLYVHFYSVSLLEYN